MNNNLHYLLIIAIMVVVTLSIRALPFILFHDDKRTPKIIDYLGKALSPAMMSLLVIYCIRSVDFTSGNYGIPECIGLLTAILLHVWKRNTLLSISASTIIYMILVQLVFI